MPRIYVSLPIADRFWPKVIQSEDGGCWDWSAGKNNHGYGKVGRQYAHRVSWELHYGVIPTGMFVMHKCDNPPCTNPAHLALGTQKDNMADAARKGRLDGRWKPSGEANKAHKLSAAQVVEMRGLRAAGHRVDALAKVFGVRRQTITAITTGRSRIKG